MADQYQFHDPHMIVDPHNSRIKVMDSRTPNLSYILENWQELAKDHKVGKLTIYALRRHVEKILQYGFHEEGKIDGFFQGTNAYIMSVFPDRDRGHSEHIQEEDEIIALAQSKELTERKALPHGFHLRQAQPRDVEQLVHVFKTVFPLYPTPVHDPQHVLFMMSQNVDFMVIEHEGNIVSVASAEITEANGCAELTDCATLPEFRGQSLLSYLFFALEDYLEKKGIYYLFSLTRAISPGMNITTAKHGYQYRGRLVNNCIISTGFEDMNIWCKPLRDTTDDE